MAATDDFATSVAFTLREEGGYSCDPGDPGGATNFGITIATLSAWRKAACTPADVQNLTPAEAETIYAVWYWNAVSANSLPTGVNLMVFDHGVNAGAGRSEKTLQAILNVDQDGSVGPYTVGAALRAKVADLIPALGAAQTAYYRSLTEEARFLDGWLGRVSRRQALAEKMAGLSDALEPGDSGGAVTKLQLALIGLHHLAPPPDGDYGPATEAAVRAFQAASGLTPDGVAGPLTQRALHLTD